MEKKGGRGKGRERMKKKREGEKEELRKNERKDGRRITFITQKRKSKQNKIHQYLKS